MRGPTPRRPGAEKQAQKGWFAARKWLLIRRAVQLGLLALFMPFVLPLYHLCLTLFVGDTKAPTAAVAPEQSALLSWILNNPGFRITEGTLASSRTLDVLPLSDPLMALQSLLARHPVGTTAALGAILVLVFYGIVGGRMYCSWVCPINPITDLAAGLRRKLGLKESFGLDRRIRLWALAGVLIAAVVSGMLVWELVNPITILHRALVFGGIASSGAAILVVAAIFLFDLGLVAYGWCGHLCPVGAFYGLLGEKSLLRVSAQGRDRCDDCMDCFVVCPERQVIAPALRGKDKGVGPVILSRDCTNCGRCIDVCSKDVFQFGSRFQKEAPPSTAARLET